MNVNVQFCDEAESVIIGYYSSPQDPSLYSNMGVVDTSDPRWSDYFDGFPENMRQNLPDPIVP